MFPWVCTVILSFHICPELIPSLYLSPVAWSFTHRSFHFASSSLSPTMHLYSSHVFSSFSFHTFTLGSNFLCQLFVALNHMSITSSLWFGTHSSREITLMLRNLALSSCRTVLFTGPAIYVTNLTSCFENNVLQITKFSPSAKMSF